MVQLTNATFTEPLDICHRVADHIGQNHAITLADDSKLVTLFNETYAKLRQAEMTRNVWRFSIRKAALRPINTRQFVQPNGVVVLPTLQITPPTWVAGTYLVGALVSYSSALWLNVVASNTATPGTAGSGWQMFFGSLCVNPYNSGTAYYSGELVYENTGIGTYRTFLSLMNGTNEDPVTADAYDATVTYPKDALVTSASIVYKSLVDMNLAHTPASSPTAWAVSTQSNSNQWVEIVGAVLSQINFIYPIGSGPSVQVANRNVFMLPYGYLRVAPQDPKAGVSSFLGGPGALAQSDWEFEGNYFTSSTFTPILLRFAADIVDVNLMNTMFCEGLAARIGYEICEGVTQSTERLKNCTGNYAKNMGEARTVNAIEVGAAEPPEDDWIECRK